LTIDDVLDLNNDLNYDDETRIFGRLKIDMPLFIPNIYLMVTPMDFEGTGNKNVDFKFGDKTIIANIDFFSSLTLNNYDIVLYYGLPFIKTATAEKLNIDIGIDVRIYDVEALINQPATGLQESQSFTVPIPMVFLAAQIRPLEKFAIEAEGMGIAYSNEHIFSLIGRVRWDILKPLFLAGGYRYDDIKIDEEGVLVDVSFSGPFIEAGFAF
jgi:outer membrane protein